MVAYGTCRICEGKETIAVFIDFQKAYDSIRKSSVTVEKATNI